VRPQKSLWTAWRGLVKEIVKCEQRSGNRSQRTVEAVLVTGPVFAVDSIPARALFFVESPCGCHRRLCDFRPRQTIPAIGAFRHAAPGPRVGKPPCPRAIQQNSGWTEPRIERLKPGELRYRPSALRLAPPSRVPADELQARPFCKARTTRPKSQPRQALLLRRRSHRMRSRRLPAVRSLAAACPCKHRIDPRRPNA